MKDKILVQVYLHSTLIQYSPDGVSRKLEIPIEQGSTLNNLMESLGINQSEHQLLLAVNGKIADESHLLKENDSVHLMMPISGG